MRTATIMAAFVLGQGVQLVLHTLSAVGYMVHPILFCASAGFLILAAVIAGICLQQSECEQKAEHAKTYREWAEIPEDER